MTKKDFWVNIVLLDVNFLDCFVDDAGKRFRKDLDYSSREKIGGVWNKWQNNEIPDMPDPKTLHFDQTIWSNDSLFNLLKHRNEPFAMYVYARYVYVAANRLSDNSLFDECISKLKSCFREIKDAVPLLYVRLCQCLLVEKQDLDLREELKAAIKTTDYSDDEIFLIQSLKDKLSQGEIPKGNLLRDSRLIDGAEGRPEPPINQRQSLALIIQKGDVWSKVLGAYNNKDWSLVYALTKAFLNQYPEDSRALAMMQELYLYRKWIKDYGK